MALESAQYISDLNAANPTSTDSVAQADDHIRLIKSAIKATFPNITGPVTATQSQLSSPIPSGVVVMWSGAVTAVPSGWALCNGTNGTPNLLDKFIVAAGSSYAVGATGGSLTSGAGGTHTHTEASAGGHNHGGATAGHSLTVAQMPAHTHAGDYLKQEAGTYLLAATGGTAVNFGGDIASTGSGQAHTHNISTDGAHTHTINSVGDHTHSVTPPYYALAYIMKL